MAPSGSRAGGHPHVPSPWYRCPMSWGALRMGYLDLVSAFIVVCLILFLWLAVYLFALLMMSVTPTKRKKRAV